MRSLLVTILLFATLAVGATNITVGIRGEPNFSHAGVLLAKANNDYRQQGLMVSLRSFPNERALQTALINGEIDFAIANISLLKRVPSSQLQAVIEQIDDTAFVSAQTSNILGEIAGSAVYGDPHAYESAARLLDQQNISNRVVFKVPTGEAIRSNTLQNYGVVVLDHSTQGIALRQQGLKFWQIISRDLGIPTYGDALFVSQTHVGNTALTQAFTNASLSAWQLAYDNTEQSAALISRAYNQDRIRLTEQAAAMRAFVLPDYIPIGQVNLNKLTQLFPNSIDTTLHLASAHFTSTPPLGRRTATGHWLAPVIIIAISIVILFIWQTRKANRVIRQQAQSILLLRRNETDLERLKTVLLQSYQGCVHLSISENRMYFDSLARTIFEVPTNQTEISLDSFFDYLNPANQERVRRLFWNGIASNNSFTLVFDEQSTGNTRRINARFIPTSERGQLEYCMLVRDDSESLRLDNDMRQLRMSLDQAMRANETIRSQISRSISSHIEIINQQLGLIMQEQSQNDLEDSIARALISVDHVKNILKDINLHGSQEVRQHARLEVSTLLRSLYNRAMEKSHTRGLKVLLNEPSTPVTLLADSVRVRQLLANILDNALKYTVHGQVSMSTVIVERQLTLPWIELKVIIEDTGIGLNPDQLKQFQSHATDYSAAVSGIPYLKRLAEQCGASLYAHSVEGEGTSVSLSLNAPRVMGSGNINVGKVSTLIVDMDRPYRRRLIDQLELLGVSVYAASNIRDALDEIKVNRPNNVLLAALNSTDASHQLSRLQEHQLDYVPPISVLIDETAVNRQSLYNLGASGVYTAPIAVNVLASIIEQSIAREPDNQDFA